MIKKEFICITVFLVALFNISASSNLNTNTTKIVLSNKGIDDLTGSDIFISYLGLLGSFISLISGQSDPTLEALNEIKAQLTDVLNKLDDMNDKLFSILQNVICGPIRQSLIDNVQIKLKDLLNSLKAYYNSSTGVYLINIRMKCHELSQIYTTIENYINTFKFGCNGYRSIDIEEWSRSMLKISNIFSSVFESCLNVFGESTFDLNKFRDEFPQVIDYHKSYSIPLEFVRDQETGLREIVKKMLNQGLDAYQIESQLIKDYSYLKWQIIRYEPKKTGDSDSRYSVGAITDENTSRATLCDSIHWMEKLQNGKNALVAWCAEEQYNNDIQFKYKWVIGDGYELLSAEASVLSTQFENLPTNFVFATNVNERQFVSKLFEAAGNVRCDDYFDQNQFQIKLKQCASKKANFYKPPKNLSGQSIMFSIQQPTKSTTTTASTTVSTPNNQNMKIEYIKLTNSAIINNNLLNTLIVYQANIADDCQKKCSDNSNCFAVSATNSQTPGLNIFTCRLYNSNQISFVDSHSVASFVKTIKYDNLRTYQGDAFEFQGSIENCWRSCLNDINCVSITISPTNICTFTDKTRQYWNVQKGQWRTFSKQYFDTLFG